MRYEGSNLNQKTVPSKVVIICLERDRERVCAAIDESASLQWRSTGEIRLLIAEERSQFRSERGDRDGKLSRNRNFKEINAEIEEIAPPFEGARILTVGAIQVRPGIGEGGDSRGLTRIQSVAELTNQLPPILQKSGLDWHSESVAQLRHYHLSQSPSMRVDGTRVERWLDQFRRADSEWIGIALLKLLELWPTSKVCEHLFYLPGVKAEVMPGDIQRWFEVYDHIAFGDMHGGESSVLVSRLIFKGLDSGMTSKQVDFKTRLMTDQTASRILFLEDCLMTGTELIKVFRTLTEQQINKHKIDLKFAFATEAGKRRLQSYLKYRGIRSVRIHEPPDGFFPNVSAAGLRAYEKGDFLKREGNHEFNSPSADIIDGISIRARDFYNSNQRKKILMFCRAIGEPLMRIHFKNKQWTQKKIDLLLPDSALGPSNLGLLLAFAHGVSKPVLPLFWAGGDINVRLVSHGRRFVGEWEPLFPPTTQLAIVPRSEASPDVASAK